MRICSAHFEWNDYTTTFSFHTATLPSTNTRCTHRRGRRSAREREHIVFYAFQTNNCTNPSKSFQCSRNANLNRYCIHCVMHSTATWQYSVKKKKSECLLFALPKVYGKSQWLYMKMQKFVSLACKHTMYCLQLFDALHCSPTILLYNTFYYFIFSNIHTNAQVRGISNFFCLHQFPDLLWIILHCTCFVPKFSRDYYLFNACINNLQSVFGFLFCFS